MDKLGFDGIGFNEHHTSPYGLMTSPNIMAAAASQRTTNMKLLIMGNLLPIHDPLRVAEELAMLDCMSDGRVISGFARGIPREYSVYNVDLAESRARFEEAWEIIKLAWTEEVFSYEGRFWSYNDVAIWPRPGRRFTLAVAATSAELLPALSWSPDVLALSSPAFGLRSDTFAGSFTGFADCISTLPLK